MSSIFKKLRRKLGKDEQADILPPNTQLPKPDRRAVPRRPVAEPAPQANGIDESSEIVIVEEITGEHEFTMPPQNPDANMRDPSQNDPLARTEELFKLDEDALFKESEGYNPYDTNVGINTTDSVWNKLKKR
ncbi:MAG: hypothetical protein AAAFM81_14220 [Pseudomonadota bacterium]